MPQLLDRIFRLTQPRLNFGFVVKLVLVTSKNIMQLGHDTGAGLPDVACIQRDGRG